MTNPFTGRRRRAHLTARLSAAPEGPPATETPAAMPGPALDWPVPPAQLAAERARSGPQPAYPPHPSGPQPAYAPHPRAQPYPALQEPSQHAPRSMQDTQSWTPDFAVRPVPPRRPSAPRRPAQAPCPLPPVPLTMAPVIGDDLRQSWPTLGETGGRPLEDWHDLCAVRYPTTGSFSEYATTLRMVDLITRSHGVNRWPLAALPAADERWAALIDALRQSQPPPGADPEHAGSHQRLLEAVIAAPDCETALRLAQLAHQVGAAIIPTFTPSSEHPGEAS